jgi:hypothetical protein
MAFTSLYDNRKTLRRPVRRDCDRSCARFGNRSDLPRPAARPVNDNYKYTWRQLEICMADSVFRQRLDLCTATFEMRTADTDLPVPGEMKPRTV